MHLCVEEWILLPLAVDSARSLKEGSAKDGRQENMARIAWNGVFAQEKGDFHPPETTPESDTGDISGGEKRPISLSAGVQLVPISGISAPAKRSELDHSVAISTEVSEGASVRPRMQNGIMPENIPSLHCSICSIGPECPEYKEGYLCAYDPRFRDCDVDTIDGVVTQMAAILQENMLRLKRSRLHEDLVLGGQISKEVTDLTSVCMTQAKALAEMQRSFRRTTVVGSSEGILSKLFGGLVKKPDIVIEASPVPQALGAVEEIVPTSTSTPVDSVAVEARHDASST